MHTPFEQPTPLDDSPYAWKQRGACVGEDLAIFFPEGRDRESQLPAKRICQGCPVKVQCREEALSRPEDHGVWGGMDERELRRLRKYMKESLPGHRHAG